MIHQELKDSCYLDCIHIPMKCDIKGCSEEASYWLPNLKEKTDTYLCLHHGTNLMNDDGMYAHLDTKKMEIVEEEMGSYMCHEDCPICNM